MMWAAPKKCWMINCYKYEISRCPVPARYPPPPCLMFICIFNPQPGGPRPGLAAAADKLWTLIEFMISSAPAPAAVCPPANTAPNWVPSILSMTALKLNLFTQDNFSRLLVSNLNCQRQTKCSRTISRICILTPSQLTTQSAQLAPSCDSCTGQQRQCRSASAGVFSEYREFAIPLGRG